MFENVRILPKQLNGQRDQVVEINRIAPLEPLLILRVDVSDLQHLPVCGLNRHLPVFLRAYQLIFLMGDPGEKHLLLIELCIDLQMPADIFHKTLRIICIIDIEVSLVSQPVNKLPQDPNTGRVEGRYVYRFRSEPDHPVYPLPHLAGRLVGKCNRADIPRRDPLLPDQPRDPVCEDSGLAGPCSCQDQKRAVHMHRRFLLLWIQSL